MAVEAALIIMVMTEMAVVGEAVEVGITTKAMTGHLLGTLGLATKSATEPGTLLLTVTIGWTTQFCRDGKSCKLPFKLSSAVSSSPLELDHSDI
ncbi:hypothetical protein MRB53_014337 [Persea americana]|uniref:Uncharacterized protein n=1 Tax=Persea americana TaxID=3435 RepID=A0ACC2KAR9_PERAE|nr:hypothetical protein MRB53_014337 [Persea americana]